VVEFSTGELTVAIVFFALVTGLFWLGVWTDVGK
jgi:hypothetical protein